MAGKIPVMTVYQDGAPVASGAIGIRTNSGGSGTGGDVIIVNANKMGFNMEDVLGGRPSQIPVTVSNRDIFDKASRTTTDVYVLVDKDFYRMIHKQNIREGGIPGIELTGELRSIIVTLKIFVDHVILSKSFDGLGISNAQINQIVSVETVDVNGVPTAFKAVDAPSGGGGSGGGIEPIIVDIKKQGFTVSASTEQGSTVNITDLNRSLFETICKKDVVVYLYDTFELNDFIRLDEFYEKVDAQSNSSVVYLKGHRSAYEYSLVIDVKTSKTAVLNIYKSAANLGILNAQKDQIVGIESVDAEGNPLTYKAIDISSGQYMVIEITGNQNENGDFPIEHTSLEVIDFIKSGGQVILVDKAHGSTIRYFQFQNYSQANFEQATVEFASINEAMQYTATVWDRYCTFGKRAFITVTTLAKSGEYLQVDTVEDGIPTSFKTIPVVPIEGLSF